MSGSIELGRRDIRAMPPWEIMEHIGLVSQSSDEQIFTARCDTEIAFALESLGVPRARIIETVSRSLGEMGLEGRGARNPATLSGGEKKRLLLACLAAIDPQVWVLDEALPELDGTWRSRVLDLLEERGRTTILLDSRLTPLHAARGRRFGVLSRGRIAGFAGEPDAEVVRVPALAEGILAAGRPMERRSAAPSKLLRLDSVRLRFTGEESFSLAIDSLELESGTICALLGRNGSGKSTLARILCGLLRAQEGGTFLWNGSGYREAPAAELNRRIGYLFQNPDHQIFLPSVFDELALGLRKQGVDAGETARRVEEACRRFLLPDPAALPSLMSFGARRRLQAATYFLLRRDLLILDEVDTGLSYRELEVLVKELFTPQTGILLITHDAALARAVSDRILLLSSGRVRADLQQKDFDRLEDMLDEDGDDL